MVFYACFSGQDYEERGGWNDLDGLAQSLEEAQALLPLKQLPDWAHVVIFDENPRVVSEWFRRDRRGLNMRLHGERWYNEGSEEWRVLTQDTDLQFSNMEPFEPELITEWQERLARRHA